MLSFTTALGVESCSGDNDDDVGGCFAESKSIDNCTIHAGFL